MGNPPPYAATRASVVMPAKSDGSPWIKLKKCVGTPNRAVYALFCAISMERSGPIHPAKALRLPPSSRIATFSVWVVIIDSLAQSRSMWRERELPSASGVTAVDVEDMAGDV